MKLQLALLVTMLLISSCVPMSRDTIPTHIPTVISEASLMVTEQFMASIAKTEDAMTRVAQPTLTPMPNATFTPANLPTLTPITNSTPARVGAFFEVSPDVLGSRYEIENACYYDTQSGWERYEIYAGAISGSGDNYSAQGAVVIRHFRVGDRDGKARVELVDAKELLTLKKLGPLRLPAFGNCGDDSILLKTPLNFGWFLGGGGTEFYQYEGIIPFARMQVGGQTQLARVGSYCWKGGCADGPAISTSSEPLPIGPAQLARLTLPLEEAPTVLSLSAMFVSSPGKLEYEYSHGDTVEWSYETPGREQLDLGSLPLQGNQDIKFSMKPGYYVLTLLAVWKDYGDVKYGFLIEVRE